MKLSIFSVFLLLSVAGLCHPMQHTNAEVQSTPFSNSTLLKTYENGYKAYLNESNHTNIKSVILMGLEAFNLLKDGADTYDRCTVTITSPSGEIIAGATSDIRKNENIIDTCLLHTLWVHEEYRRRGFGTKVMQALRYVKSKKCILIELQAYEYQNHTKDFFETLGFKTVATVPNPDAVTGSEMYTMRKTLSDSDIVTDNTLETNYQLRIETSWSETSSQLIVDQLESYNAKQDHTISDDPYAIFLVSDTNEIIGGATGYIVGFDNRNSYCALNIFFLDERHRKHGLGTKLMREIFHYAQNKGCQLIELDTFEWQARGFYEKLGFIIVATVPNMENCYGREQYYMRKILA